MPQCLVLSLYKYQSQDVGRFQLFAVAVLAAQKQGVLIEMLITILMHCPRTTGGLALSLICWLVKISKT